MRKLVLILAIVSLIGLPILAQSKQEKRWRFLFQKDADRNQLWRADDPRIANPLNRFHPRNPLSLTNRFHPDNDFNPVNRFRPDNPLNPINRFDSDSPLNPLNRFRSPNDPSRSKRIESKFLWEDSWIKDGGLLEDDWFLQDLWEELDLEP